METSIRLTKKQKKEKKLKIFETKEKKPLKKQITSTYTKYLRLFCCSSVDLLFALVVVVVVVVVLLLLTATQLDLRLPHLFLPLFFPLPPTSLHTLPTLPTSILHLLSSSRWSTLLVPLRYPACSSVGCHCFSPPLTHRSCLCPPAFNIDHSLVSHHHFFWLDLSLNYGVLNTT